MQHAIRAPQESLNRISNLDLQIPVSVSGTASDLIYKLLVAYSHARACAMRNVDNVGLSFLKCYFRSLCTLGGLTHFSSAVSPLALKERVRK